jgi:hypothetical protein
MDDSISVIELPSEDEENAFGVKSDEEGKYFIIEDNNENEVGWIVSENVKYVVLGELVDNFKNITSVKQG